MDILLLLARLVLAGTFVVAGVTKLADLTGSKKAMRDFGLPQPIAGYAGIALPVAELVVAVALVPVATAWWGALGALLLLLAFLGGIGYNLSQGRTPDCHCFGQVHSEPIGPATIIRNGVLAAIAAFVLIAGWNDAGTSVVGWFGDMSTLARWVLVGAIAGVAVLALQGWFLVQLLQQSGRLLLRLDALESGTAAANAAKPAATEGGLPIGAVAPEFALPNLAGEQVSLAALRDQGKPVLLVFTDPGCGPCTALMPEIGAWQREHADKLAITLVSRGDAAANLAKTGTHGIERVLLQQQREVAERFGVKATPGAVLVRPNGAIGSSPAVGADAIRALVTMSVTQPAAPARPTNGHVAPRGLEVGTPAPALALPDLEGNERTLAEFQGRPTLVLFWNPTCGFCGRMLDDLKAWEATATDAHPQVVAISRGSVESNVELGLRSTVLLDQEFTTGRLFGSGGTPSAVLIDADGKVASSVAVGAAAVFALANDTGAAVPSRSES